MMYACGTDYGVQVESFWRYTKGTGCNDAIYLGEVTSGTAFSHHNSNSCYSNNFTPPAGYPGNDVFYLFNVTQPTGVNIAICNADMNMHFVLLDDSCNVVFRDSINCSSQIWLCESGFYTIVVDGASVIDAAPFTIEISENPNLVMQANQIAQTDLTCYKSEDGFILAQYSGGNSPLVYNWSNGDSSSTLQNLPAGIYSLTVTDALGCSMTNSFTILEPAQITTSVSSSDAATYLSNDGTALVTANNCVGNCNYSWSNGETSSAIVNLAGDSTYYITVTDDNGCVGVDSVYIGVIDSNDAIGNLNAEFDFIVYPNPVKDFLTIESSSSIISSIVINDILGREIFSTVCFSLQYSLNTANWNSGVYLMKIETENGFTVKRFVVRQ